VTRVDGAAERRDGVLRIGTRGSALAVAQTTAVAESIARATGVDVELVTVTTHGDTSRESLAQLGGTGVFATALRDALRAGDQGLGDRRVPLPGNDRQLQILGLGDRELRLTFAAHSAVPGCAVFWFASYSSSPIRS
jgi:hypothetical protein